MREDRVFFHSGNLSLEGLYASHQGFKGVVISHPHPLMGGNMRNNVVEVLTSTFYEKGYATLRFNFRGVGRSEGAYDEGRGEQEDVIGAIDFLREREKKDVILAGYSFLFSQAFANTCQSDQLPSWDRERRRSLLFWKRGWYN